MFEVWIIVSVEIYRHPLHVDALVSLNEDKGTKTACKNLCFWNLRSIECKIDKMLFYTPNSAILLKFMLI